MSKSKLSLPLSALCLMLSPMMAAHADDDDNEQSSLEQELLLGETPFLQEKGEWQLGVSYQHFDYENASESGLTLEIEYGVTDRLTVAMEMPYLSVDEDGEDKESGLGDIELSFTYGLITEGDFVVSAGLGVSLTTGDEDKGLGEEDSSWEPIISVAKFYGDTQVSFSAAFEFSDDEEEQSYVLGIAKPIGGIVAALEFQSAFGDDEEEHIIAPSVLWDFSDAGYLQIGIPFSVAGDEFDKGVMASWNIEW